MGEYWGKFIVARGIKKLPKVQNMAQSGHTVTVPLEVKLVPLLVKRRIG